MRFVISITTLPDRVPYIKPVIKSIFKHNPEIDKLYICLPYGKVSQKHIPKNTSKLQVIRCKDYGPITKILGVLDYEKDPNTLILTLDDDIIIKKNIVKLFKKKSLKYPNSALSLSGWCYGCFPCNYQIVLDNEKDAKVDWIQGVHGILYRRSFVNKKEILKFEKNQPLLFKNDDHKISAYLETKKINRISINKNPVDYFQDYDFVSSINPISGGSAMGSVNFCMDVKTISKYFKEKGYYHRCYTKTKSTVFIVCSFIFLLVLLFILGYAIGNYYGVLSFSYLLLVLVLSLVLIYCLFSSKYKDRYILEKFK